MFSFFKKIKSIREPDKIWRSREAKYSGILNDVKVPNDFLIVAHFRETFENLKALLRQSGQAFSEINSSSALENLFFSYSTPAVYVTLSETIESFQFYENPAYEEQLKNKKVLILVSEHYPIPTKDRTLMDVMNKLPFETRLRFYESLDAPMLKPFGSDQIGSLLDKLSIDPNECISHSFVDKAIESAQQKLAQRVSGDLPADSATLWMQMNYRASS